ncbi:helix-turn-helix domain-containing protein [Clostridium botulinum]|uniref:helix-turn-helix domain-containing protein n=1 Tax=Clostridium botulinum TaxID=1491 RepID=UPI001FA779B8|nr:helix-turn-helix transcriptional regulator [Clostridium botulinum]
MIFLNERIKELRKVKKLSQHDFGKNIHLSQNHISSIEKGIRNVTERIINDICTFYNVNKKWLLTGEGDMFKDPLDQFVIEDDEIKELVEMYLEIDTDMQKTIKEMIRKLAKK